MKRYIIIAVVWGFLGLLVCCLSYLNEDRFIEENFPEQWKQVQVAKDKAYKTNWDRVSREKPEGMMETASNSVDWRVWELEAQLRGQIAVPVFLLALLQHGADYAFWSAAMGVFCNWVLSESRAAQEMARSSFKSTWQKAD